MSGELLTAAATAGRLGVSRRRIYQLIGRKDFPAPVKVDTGGRRPLLVFKAKEIEAWKTEHR